MRILLMEAVKTNVIGTDNILTVAIEAGIAKPSAGISTTRTGWTTSQAVSMRSIMSRCMPNDNELILPIKNNITLRLQENERKNKIVEIHPSA